MSQMQKFLRRSERNGGENCFYLKGWTKFEDLDTTRVLEQTSKPMLDTTWYDWRPFPSFVVFRLFEAGSPSHSLARHVQRSWVATGRRNCLVFFKITLTIRCSMFIYVQFLIRCFQVLLSIIVSPDGETKESNSICMVDCWLFKYPTYNGGF